MRLTPCAFSAAGVVVVVIVVLHKCTSLCFKKAKNHENFESTLVLGFKLIPLDDCTTPATRFLNDNGSLKFLCSKSHVAQNWASGSEGAASSLILPFCNVPTVFLSLLTGCCCVGLLVEFHDASTGRPYLRNSVPRLRGGGCGSRVVRWYTGGLMANKHVKKCPAIRLDTNAPATRYERLLVILSLGCSLKGRYVLVQ